ncbi:response regulator [Paenibacillus sp. NEAU-GSW1]|nr:response regulator transcription factor [Paenibacillus sp. NEAU-GSW1]MUT65381.1 response regulator [Paenibacillus sp. NEAU-GSW1]
MAKLLIVEDDRPLNEGLTFALKKQGFDVVSAYSAQEGLRAFGNEEADLIILDINLPDGNGLELCKEIRRYSELPILFLTAKDAEPDMIEGFQAGADDYIAKPFSIAVLSQRIMAVLRRGGASADNRINRFAYKDFEIDYNKMKAYKGNVEVKLTATEYKLLAVLTENSKQVLTRQMLLDKLWDIDGAFVDENTLSVNIKRLRSKIEDDPKKPVFIKTVFGIGYTWGE